MPYVADAFPDEPAAVIRHARFQEYFDGQVWIFTEGDLADFGIKSDSKKLVQGRWHDGLKQLRNHITAAVRYYHGSYMYKAKIVGDKLYFVFGEMTCRVKHCTQITVTNEPHCLDHEDYNYFEERNKQASSRQFHPTARHRRRDK